MFDQFKQLLKIQQIQKELAKEKVEVEKEGIKVVINGKMEVEEIRLNPNLENTKQEALLKEVLNEATKRLQVVIAQKMMTLK